MRERECPRCHREVDLPLGQLCDACVRNAERRAARAARWVSLLTTLAFGAYTLWRLPEERPARVVGGGAVLVWYVVSRMIALRIARLWYQRWS